MEANWLLYVIGGALVLIAAVAVLKDSAISTGHAILFALGAGLIALPHVRDFEYGDGKLKFTTRDEASELAKQVQDIGEQQKALTTQLNDTTARITAAIDQINKQQAELQASMKASHPDIKLPQIKDFNSSSWHDLMLKNDQIKRQADQSILKLDQIQKNLSIPAQ